MVTTVVKNGSGSKTNSKNQRDVLCFLFAIIVLSGAIQLISQSMQLCQQMDNNDEMKRKLNIDLMNNFVSSKAATLLDRENIRRSSSSNKCISSIRNVLNAEELSASLDLLLCSNGNSLLADIVLADRLKIQTLERRVYLRDLRSYRLSGLVCNDSTEPSIPKVVTESAFKCLPREYRRRACMDGQTNFPKACDAFQGISNPKTPYIPEPERAVVSCSDNNKRCGEIPMGKGTSVDPGQLAKGVAEAKVLTVQKSDGRPIWRPAALDLHLKMIQNLEDVSPLHYPGAHAALQMAFQSIGIQNKTVAVFGSISPWVEAIVHHNEAQVPITTVDYNQPISFDERLHTQLMSDMLEDNEQFDVAISFSSIEHDGQGRYGDPLDPDGDLAAMKEVWLKVKPGGLFFLNVQLGEKDEFHWYSMRKYGPHRIPLLIRGWEFAGLSTGKTMYNPNDSFFIKNINKDSSVFILRKPQLVGVDQVLDPTKFGGLKCDSTSTKCSMV